jgi:hypothetical protein
MAVVFILGVELGWGSGCLECLYELELMRGAKSLVLLLKLMLKLM